MRSLKTKLSFKSVLWKILLISFINVTNSVGLPNFPTNFTVGDEYLSNSADQISRQYADEYIVYLKTGIESPALRAMTMQLLTHRSNNNWAHGFRGFNASEKFVACTACRTAVTVAERLIRASSTEWQGLDIELYVERSFLDFCTRFNILTNEVCKGIFRAYWPTFKYITEDGRTDARCFCGSLKISYCKMPQPSHNWVLTVNNNFKDLNKPKSEKPMKGPKQLKILQITDIHYDPDYKPGAIAECDEPLCCQRMPNETMESKNLAGYWSDYHVCDAPLHMIENALDHMRKTYHDISYIYLTGDIIPHTSWKASRASITEMFTHINRLIKEKFPGIPVYPCIGNNDAHPNNMFTPADVPENVNSRWSYENLYNLWSQYLPPITMETILKGGYYTVSPHAGFRIIALNNIECRLANIWLYYNNSFPIEQLKWLHDTLLAAEHANEFVHILAHIPSGAADCWTAWSHEFNRLVERFYHIISGIFNGHTHRSDLSVYYNSKGHAVNIAWNGGSLTSFVGKNPNYQLYIAESKTMQVIDYETWTFNLTAANMHGENSKPNWYKILHFAEEYTDDLSPAGINALLERMAAEPALLHKFWRSKVSAADPILLHGCDQKCLLDTICGLSKTAADQNTRCQALQKKLKKSLSSKSANVHGSGRNTSAFSYPLPLNILLCFISLFKVFI